MAVFNVCWCFLILGIVFCLSPSESVDPLSRCSPLLPRTQYLKAADWGKCYEFHMEERTWRSANSICSSKGGHLVTIKEERIQKFLISSLYALSWPRNGLWIGATDKEKEMEWVWVTGERVDRGYSRWAAGQPSCGFLCFEDCAVMRWKEGGRWHDYRCNWLEDYSFICEYDMLPEPTTTTVLTTTTTTTTNTTSPLPETATSPVLQTNATSIILSPSSKDLESEYLLHGWNGENRAEEGDGNDTSVGLPPAIMLDGASGARAEQVQEKLSSSQSGLGSGSVAFIVIAILVTLVAGLCFMLVIIRRRRRKLNGEDDKGISYENPYYESSAPDSGSGGSRSDDADILEETDDEGAVACCNGGGTAVGFTASAPLKKHTKMKQPPPPHHTRPRLVMNDYDTPPTLRINHTKTLERGRNHHGNTLNTKEDNRSHAALITKEDSVYYDELQSCYANSQNGYDIPRASTEPWYRNNDRRDVSPDDDEMYYNTHEENIYESVDNLTALEEQQRRTQTDEIDTHDLRDGEESRYVPFVLDDPKVDPAY